MSEGTAARNVTQAEFAWPGGDRPGALQFQRPVAADVAGVVLGCLADRLAAAAAASAKLQGLSESEPPTGRYLLTGAGEAWFVRVSSRMGSPELEQAIVRHLADASVSVNLLVVAGAELSWEGSRFRVDARPFVDGRHFDGSTEDLVALGMALRACHAALRTFPRADQVRRAAADRMDRLERTVDGIATAVRLGDLNFFAEHAPWAADHTAWLADMARGFDRQLAERPGAQCVHGEVHPANALFRRAEPAQAVLVDFEESVHLFAPPEWDVAFMVQRFCLQAGASERVARERLRAVTDGYGAIPAGLAQVMRQIAWFTVATVFDLRHNFGVVSPAAELDKFVALERQADALRKLV